MHVGHIFILFLYHDTCHNKYCYQLLYCQNYNKTLMNVTVWKLCKIIVNGFGEF